MLLLKFPLRDDVNTNVPCRLDHVTKVLIAKLPPPPVNKLASVLTKASLDVYVLV